MLLSRVAEHVYWAGRYLDRAEGTARILREHTNFIVDLPTSVPVTWEPLLLLTGTRAAFDERYERADETSIMRFLVADRHNPSSIVSSLEGARENLRTTREVLPREVWQAVNDLYLYVAAHGEDGVSRRSRSRFMERVVADLLAATGVLTSTMPRDAAYAFLQAGQYVERADMTTRLIDVRAGSILAMADAVGDTYEDVQWMSVLRSLSALQAYHRATRSAVAGPATVRFLLADGQFPRSVGFCLGTATTALAGLPNAARVTAAAEAALETLATLDPAGLDGDGLHEAMDDLQIAIGAVHDAVAAAYFVPVGVLA
jgi:uncharacterized alpha-E superfamily protein